MTSTPCPATAGHFFEGKEKINHYEGSKVLDVFYTFDLKCH